MAISNLVVRTGVGTWTAIRRLITRGLYHAPVAAHGFSIAGSVGTQISLAASVGATATAAGSVSTAIVLAGSAVDLSIAGSVATAISITGSES